MAPGDNLLRLQLIGTLVSAVAYGFVVCLFLHCLTLLLSNRRQSYTNTARSVLIAYIIVMFLLSTASAIQAFIYIFKAVFNGFGGKYDNIIQMDEPLFLPPAILGADWLLLWRCYILYYRTASLRRLVYIFLIVTSTGSLVFAVLYYLPPPLAESAFSFHSPLTQSVVTISCTTSMNLVRASLIIGRLVYHQETMRNLMGKQYASPYLRIIFMVVESCGLIVVTGIVYLILVKGADINTFNGGIIPLLLFPHICVASPLLLVVQVARGRTFGTLALSDIETPNIVGMSDDCVSAIRFQQHDTVRSRS
ncbi:hypothetical protein BDN70DRAFT_880064 [Pholiota conissans]|uniref:Uncharacterized protein n=1 Tax=Pholiota conissans TaxID=109636 RepID=A0A9P5Z1F9_9AGAR|nr:hypothetical protein BDN70DRAFT_880064 [Pholiota conissans]